VSFITGDYIIGRTGRVKHFVALSCKNDRLTNSSADIAKKSKYGPLSRTTTAPSKPE
jgi:hypothetical protein